jgi:hypothetical protein
MSYIGNDLRSGRSEVYHYTSASGGETTITSLADGRSINYTVGWCTVYLNGVRMHDSDVTLTSGSSVVFGTALAQNDVVIVEASHTFSVSDSVPKSGGTFDGAVTFDGSIQQKTTTQNLSGTYSTEQLFLNDSYTLTGDITVSGHLALGSIADEDIVITQDSTERTITGSGTLESGDLLHTAEDSTDLTDMTGELGSAVTFPAGHIINTYYATTSVASSVSTGGGTGPPNHTALSIANNPTFLSLAVTPTSSSSKFLIQFNSRALANMGVTGWNTTGNYYVTDGTTNICHGQVGFDQSAGTVTGRIVLENVSLCAIHEPASANAITYYIKFYTGANYSNTFTLSNGNSPSFLIIQEIAG